VLLVDGYNVINAVDSLSSKMRREIALARDELVRLLSLYGHYMGFEVVVVFDAHGGINPQRCVEEEGGVKIIYSKKGETADTVIEHLTAELVENASVFVVTSDTSERLLVRGMGAFTMTPLELEREIKQVQKEIADKYGR